MMYVGTLCSPGTLHACAAKKVDLKLLATQKKHNGFVINIL